MFIKLHIIRQDELPIFKSTCEKLNVQMSAIEQWSRYNANHSMIYISWWRPSIAREMNSSYSRKPLFKYLYELMEHATRKFIYFFIKYLRCCFLYELQEIGIQWGALLLTKALFDSDITLKILCPLLISERVAANSNHKTVRFVFNQSFF